MLKNRSIQVRLAKDSELGDAAVPALNKDEIESILDETGKKLVKGTVTVMAAWIALDTARRVIVQNTQFKK